MSQVRRESSYAAQLLKRRATVLVMSLPGLAFAALGFVWWPLAFAALATFLGPLLLLVKPGRDRRAA
jgi:hypothetical protein